MVTKDIEEPYRMLTSRSEYRLILRQDNADERLTPIGYKLGLVSEEQYRLFCEKQKKIKDEVERLKETKIPLSPETNAILAKYNEKMERGMKASELLKRPSVDYRILKEVHPETAGLNISKDIYESAEIEIKYDGYIKRQNQQIEMLDKLEKIKIPEDIDYSQMNHISTETREKLAKIRPATLGQASRIGGVKPADISVLMVMLNK